MSQCPNCKCEVTSGEHYCPACGHQLDVTLNPSVIDDFVRKVDECDRKIANQSRKKLGYSNWSSAKKTCWIIFNIYFCCIPLLIYYFGSYFKTLFSANSAPPLSVAEKEKVNMIENYTFDNDNDSVVNALIFMESKIDFLSLEPINAKTYYWTRIWGKKARNIHEIAPDVVERNDIAKHAYERIEEQVKTVSENFLKKRKKVLTIIGAIFIGYFAIGTILTVLTYIGILSESGIDTDYSINFSWPTTSLAQVIPSIDGKAGRVSYSSDGEISIDIKNFTSQEFSEYVLKCKNERDFTNVFEESANTFISYNKDGVKVELYLYHNNELNIRIEDAHKMTTLYWPNTELVNLIPTPTSKVGCIDSESSTSFNVFVGDTSLEDYNEYVNNCINNGFKVNYSKDKYYFSADHENGADLRVEYLGNNTMEIYLYWYKD